MMEQKRMGLLIKKLREKQNLTQQQLADMIPISREAISNGKGVELVQIMK